jgi:flagellar motility protein MotE (MotC chaperone)
MSAAHRRRARGTLTVIAALLLASALVRVGEGVGQAMARATPEVPVDDRAPSGETCAQPADLQALLDTLREREAGVASRERALEDRNQALAIADEQVTRRLAELQAAEDSLRRTLAIAETAAEDDLDRLTRVYETMKPKQAAALFEQMDARFAAGFLARMRPDAAAAIMAGLSPQAAHMFSVVLAGRNAEGE